MTVSTDIRGAIQTLALTVPGFPSKVAYEGRVTDPKNYEDWARINMVSSFERPYDLSGRCVQYEGMAQISLFTPSKGGPGTKTIENLADNLKSVFVPALRIRSASGSVFIRYSEKSPLIEEPDWLQIPVTIGYRLFKTT